MAALSYVLLFPFVKEKEPVTGNLGKIKRHLKEKYRKIIEESEENPDFLVINAFSESQQMQH